MATTQVVQNAYDVAAAARRLESACLALTLTNNANPAFPAAVGAAEAALLELFSITGSGSFAIIEDGVQYHQQVIRDGEPVVTATVTYTIANGAVMLVDSEIGG